MLSQFDTAYTVPRKGVRELSVARDCRNATESGGIFKAVGVVVNISVHVTMLPAAVPHVSPGTFSRLQGRRDYGVSVER